MEHDPSENEDALTERISDLFDRMINASVETTDPNDLKEARKWVHGYHCKFAADPNPHRPTDRLLAQLLAIATPTQIQAFILELMNEAKPAGNTYAWYVREAIERVHHIAFRRDPDFTRKKLKLHQGGAPKPEHP
jgi:hypothetical protein